MATILVVDDHIVLQRIVVHILNRHGHTTLVAFNGQEALNILEQTPTELVIADLAMPEMDGLTLLRHLRTSERWARLPVIMLTASAQEGHSEIARALGANEFLTKPTSSWQLIETVNRVLAEASIPTAST